MSVQLPPPELLEDEVELLLDEDVELLEDEVELLLDEVLELELVEELELLPELPLMVPAEAVSVTLSSRAPSSLRSIRSVCEPAARLPKVVGVMPA
jgi:hypothetical protein